MSGLPEAIFAALQKEGLLHDSFATTPWQALDEEERAAFERAAMAVVHECLVVVVGAAEKPGIETINSLNEEEINAAGCAMATVMILAIERRGKLLGEARDLLALGEHGRPPSPTTRTRAIVLRAIDDEIKDDVPVRKAPK